MRLPSKPSLTLVYMFSTSLLLACLLVSSTLGPEPNLEPPVLRNIRELNWYTGKLEAALEVASDADSPTCIYFWANTETCSRFDRDVLADSRIHEALGIVVCFRADASSEYGHELAQRFGVETVPALYFMTSDGSPEDVILGYLSATSLASEVARIERGEKTVSGLRQQIEMAPDNFELRAELMAKLASLGEEDALTVEREALKKLDPRGETYIGASAHFASLESSAYAHRQEHGSFDLNPMYRFASCVKNEEIRTEVWAWIAFGETIERNDRGMRRAYKRWWELAAVPPGGKAVELSGFLNPACHLVQAFFDSRESGLSAQEMALVLEVAEAANALVTRAEVSKDDSIWADIYSTMGLAQWLNNEGAVAVEYMERAIRIAPEDSFYQDVLRDMRKG